MIEKARQGGKGLLMSNTAFTLSSSNFHALFIPEKEENMDEKEPTQIFLAQPSTVRRLTPVECERLQGFEDGWTEGQADTHRYKQMGNAVAVPCVSWIVERMVGLIGD